MTVVAGIVGPDGTIHMGADSAASNEHQISVARDPKVFVKGEIVLGYCGSLRVGQVLREVFDPPRVRGRARSYLVRDFIPALQDTLRAARCDHHVRPVAHGHVPGWLLVGLRRQLFRVDADYHVWPLPYAAIGSGAQYALGALAVAYHQPFIDARERVLTALVVAEGFTPTVRRPFVAVAGGLVKW